MFTRLHSLLYPLATGLLLLLVAVNVAIPSWILLHLDQVSLGFHYRPSVVETEQLSGTYQFAPLIDSLGIPSEIKSAVQIEEISASAGEQCAYTVSATRTIYIDPSCSDSPLRAVLTHEIGHIVDAIRMTENTRQVYCDLRGITDCGTWAESTYAIATEGISLNYNWLTSPAEDFAEEFVRHTLDAGYTNHTTVAQAGDSKDLTAFWQTLLR